MIHAYVIGGIASWILAGVAAVALAQAAGRDCPTPTSDVPGEPRVQRSLSGIATSKAAKPVS
jgi:hypothetical protein